MTLNLETKLVTLQGEQLQDLTLVEPVIKVYEASYSDHWLGRDHYLKSTLRNTSRISYLPASDGRIAAITQYNGNRMLMLAAARELQGGGYANELLKRVLEEIPQTWMTADVNSLGMLKTLTGEGLGLQLVESIHEIGMLFRSTQNVSELDQFVGKSILHDFLERRLKSQKRKFIAFTHSESVHGPEYMQFAFKHVPS